ncbi:MAG: hypothetical protein JRI97_12605 [Deltaproteobacteria bacterium]|nr:hypothetical protein [Deltaproteobacteria bacterium]
MIEAYTLTLDNQAVRFTPDGKIAVLDAIRAVAQSDNAERMLENLKTKYPEIMALCEGCHFQGEGANLVADSSGWEMISMLLLDHLMDSLI